MRIILQNQKRDMRKEQSVDLSHYDTALTDRLDRLLNRKVTREENLKTFRRLRKALGLVMRTEHLADYKTSVIDRTAFFQNLMNCFRIQSNSIVNVANVAIELKNY
uniref:Uncharacterized protein n=1 Tax=Romanomermis culicivorax TaxID=13658 RepID=A0A915KH00_ROMCU